MLNKNIENDDNESKTQFDSLSFPIIRRVMSNTIGANGFRKSTKQQQREDRINKLRVLNGDLPDIILPDDESYGLISVTPLSAPNPNFSYFDFVYKYDDTDDIIKK